jgi:hypothetical protein
MHKLLHIIASAIVLAASSAHAQTPQQQPSSNLPRLERYYEKSFDVPAYILAWEKAGRQGTDAVLGFLAGVFTKSPQQIPRVGALSLEKPAQLIIVQALRFAQKTDDARMFAQRWGWPVDELARIAPVPSLLATRPEQPGHFDTFWGASFATGDAAYVRPIFDYYAGATTEPDIDVNDIVAVVVSRSKSDKDTTDQIARKYPRERLRWVIFAASALWSLDSNARQHRFVATALDSYVKESPTSAASKGVLAMRAALNAPPR